jgi:hypothetical protein
MIIQDKISLLEEKIKVLEAFKEQMDKERSLSKNFVNTDSIQTLSRKVLKVPLIDDFTNAQHDHSTDGTGGDLSDYAKLIGRSGGQTLYGGIGSGENLYLKSTSHPIKGNIKIADGVLFDNPTALQGDGVLIKHASQLSVTPNVGQNLSLINLNIKNTDTVDANSFLWGLVINFDSDAIDTGGAIGLTNSGKADTIYMSVKGKAGAVASSPTGLGVDLNRNGSVENSTLFTGYGIQIYDWSQTNISGGPVGIYLRKQNNLNSDHLLQKFTANRKALFIETPEGVGYDGAQMIWGIGTAVGVYKSYFNAGGGLVFSGAKFLEFVMPSGNSGAIWSDTGGPWLRIKGGESGFQLLNNAISAAIIQVADAGDVVITPQGGGYLSFGTYTAKGAEAFAGFITLKDGGGTLRKIMVCA